MLNELAASPVLHVLVLDDYHLLTDPRIHEAVEFLVAYNGVSVEVRHTGSEPALFKPGLPVVVEGHWDATINRFDSDRLLVKHTADYVAQHPDRVQTSETSIPTSPSSAP